MARARVPPVITSAYLERVVARYLSRHYTSAAHLRRLLLRRVHRSVAHHGGDPAEWIPTVDALLARLLAHGVLDDGAFARAKARVLQGRGCSERVIRGRLAEKGLAASQIEDALGALAEEVEDADFQAAVTYVRKRRLGPWRGADRAAHRERDLARLARRGFGYEVAVQVIDAPEPEPG